MELYVRAILFTLALDPNSKTINTRGPVSMVLRGGKDSVKFLLLVGDVGEWRSEGRLVRILISVNLFRVCFFGIQFCGVFGEFWKKLLIWLTGFILITYRFWSVFKSVLVTSYHFSDSWTTALSICVTTNDNDVLYFCYWRIYDILWKYPTMKLELVCSMWSPTGVDIVWGHSVCLRVSCDKTRV